MTILASSPGKITFTREVWANVKLELINFMPLLPYDEALLIEQQRYIDIHGAFESHNAPSVFM